MDTIFAVSSGAPPAAIAVLRISGPRAFDAARALGGTLPAMRQAAVRTLRDPADGELLDRAIILLFPRPRSATGEDVAELHLHGGRAVVRRVEQALAGLPGLRGAMPGEFTRRALAAGRIDLAEAEGLGDLLMAETEAQRRAALAAAEGAVSRQAGEWTRAVLDLAARVEALLDFSDESDVDEDHATLDVILSRLGAVVEDIDGVLAVPPVERLREGVRVVLAGPPNSGKSTLFNAMLGRDAAIVSPIAGTTRDLIEAPVVRDGIAYLLVDTAGLAEATDDPIEAIGIDRAGASIAAADIVLWLGDGVPPRSGMVLLHARADLSGRAAVPEDRLAVSASLGGAVDKVWQHVARRAEALVPRGDQLALNARQRALVEQCRGELEAATTVGDPVLFAEHLRLARDALDRITGHAGVEDMLDALFARFCIGK